MDIDEKSIETEINKKSSMLLGSLEHRKKFFDQQDQKTWIFPAILREHKEMTPSEVCLLYIHIFSFNDYFDIYKQEEFMIKHMEEYGLNIIENNFIPTFGTTFILNESENGWNYNIFVFDCCDPNDRDIWYGYLPNQRNRDKYDNNRINLNGLFYIDSGQNNSQTISSRILDKSTYTHLKLYIIHSNEINNVGCFGPPLKMKFEIKDSNIPIKTNKMWIKFTNESLQILKDAIPKEKHHWIGLTD